MADKTDRRTWVEVSEPRLQFALTNLKSLKLRTVPGWNSSEKILTINTAIIAIECLLNEETASA